MADYKHIWFSSVASVANPSTNFLLGAAFGADGYLRISYATSMAQLEEGVTRIRRFVEKIS